MNTADIKKLIIFDLDGTLANSLLFYINVINHNKKMFNTDGVDPLEIDDLKDFSIRYFIKEFKIGLFKIRKLQRFLEDEFDKNIPNIPLKSGIKEVLQELASREDVKIGLLTSNSQSNANLYLKAHGVLDVFSFVLSSNNLFGKHKSLKKLQKFYHILPSQVFYVGDEIRDIQAAQKSGVNSIAVTWGFNSREVLKKHEPDYLIDTPEELYDIF